MATIAPIELIKISSFTVGVDTYPDIRRLRLRRNPLNTYRYRPEGSLRPTKIHQVATDSPPVSGSIEGSTLSMDALAGTSAATATVTGIDAVSGVSKTVTITNPSFLGFSGGGGERAPESSSLEFEATDFSVA